MTDVSLLEYAGLAVVAYSGIIILIIAMIKDVPTSKASAGIRMIAALPSMIANAALMGTGLKIVMPTMSTNSTTFGYNITTSAVIERFSENVTSGGANIIMGPSWMLFHFGMFLFLMLFMAIQILMIMTKTE